MHWDDGKTYAEIAQFYARYTKSLMDYDGSEKCLVIFDGYNHSTKDHEHRNRQGQGFREIEVTGNNKVMTSKAKFLSNSQNKNGLIKLIIGACQEIGIAGEQAISDADTLITKRAIESSSEGAVNVIANDTDILILLLYHRESFQNFVFLSEGEKSYDIHQIASSMSAPEKRSILLVHSFSGCDTVSAVFGYGKKKFLKMTNEENKVPCKILKTFLNKDSSKEKIQESGVKLFELMFQRVSPKLAKTVLQRKKAKRKQTSEQADGNLMKTKQRTLSELRLVAYKGMCAREKIQPERLPATEGAAVQHSLRSFLQIHDWMTLQCTSLNPTQYGWQRNSPDSEYEPIGSLDPIAPQQLQSLISCGCKTGCENNRCSCRRNNIKCLSFCSVCRGVECENAQQGLIQAEDNDICSDSEEEYDDVSIVI